MHTQSSNIQHMDLYLLDQILKGRIKSSDKILDAGCGEGRNLSYFINNAFNIYACDKSKGIIEKTKKSYSAYFDLNKEKISIESLSDLSYASVSFDYIICNAVLHFAKNAVEFINMFGELYRILKRGGTLFIRATSDFGLNLDSSVNLDEQILLKDGTYRFILTLSLLERIKIKYPFKFIDPIKSVLVEDKRSMSIIVIQKK